MNNVVYSSSTQASSCKTGMVQLLQCPECGLVFNAAYDEKTIAYDGTYDNGRGHSSSYLGYLDFLCEKFAPWLNDHSNVLEIGCGNGDFLKNLSDMTGCLAFGYDSTYVGRECHRGRVFFSRECYKIEKSRAKYDMIILRHVLEHIAKPLKFMLDLSDASSVKEGTRLLLEVPNFEWIINKNTYFDITYEHCNYFVSESLTRLATKVGFEVESVIETFNGQYLLLCGIYAGKKRVMDTFYGTSAGSLAAGCRTAKDKLVKSISEADNVCVWGASGKGVVFLSDLSEEVLKKVTYVIDINPSKQGKFLPVSGKRVDPPAVLKQAGDGLLVIVMNGVYKGEICSQIDGMGVQASVMTAC